MHYLIAYDIRSSQRGNRVHRYLKNWGLAIEYSLFLVETSESRRDLCLQGLAALIDPKQDDLRCYPLPARGLKQRLGRAVLPEGIHWTGLPTGLEP